MIVCDLEIWIDAYLGGGVGGQQTVGVTGTWITATPDVRISGPWRWDAGLPPGAAERTARTGSLEATLDLSAAATVRPAGWLRDLQPGVPARVALLRPPPLATPWCGCVTRHQIDPGSSYSMRLDFDAGAGAPAPGDWIVLRGGISTASGRWPTMRVRSVTGTAGTGRAAVVESPDDGLVPATSPTPNPVAVRQWWARVDMAALPAPAVRGGGLEADAAAGVRPGDVWTLDGVTWSDGAALHLAHVASVAAGRMTLRAITAGVTVVSAAAPRGAPAGVMRRRLYSLRDIDSSAGTGGDRQVAVAGVDVIGALSTLRMQGAQPAGQAGQMAQRIFEGHAGDGRWLGGGVSVVPDVDVDLGPTLPLPVPADGGVLARIAEVTRSAWGRCYVRASGSSGELFVWTSREHDRPPRRLDATFTPAPATGVAGVVRNPALGRRRVLVAAGGSDPVISTLQRRHGVDLRVDLPFETDAQVAAKVAAGLLAASHDYLVSAVDLVAEASAEAERTAVTLDVGSFVSAREPLTGATGDYLVSAVEVERDAAVTRIRYHLAPVDETSWATP